MAITTKLELRQTHNLVMTPQLQQAIKLLQLSNIELASFVEAELERNPLLEHADSDETGGAAGEPAVEPGATSKEDERGGGSRRVRRDPVRRRRGRSGRRRRWRMGRS